MWDALRTLYINQRSGLPLVPLTYQHFSSYHPVKTALRPCDHVAAKTPLLLRFHAKGTVEHRMWHIMQVLFGSDFHKKKKKKKEKASWSFATTVSAGQARWHFVLVEAFTLPLSSHHTDPSFLVAMLQGHFHTLCSG